MPFKVAPVPVMNAAGYDVLITFDQNLPYQQNADLPVAVIVLKARNNRVETAVKFAPQICAGLPTGFTQRLLVLELNG